MEIHSGNSHCTKVVQESLIDRLENRVAELTAIATCKGACTNDVCPVREDEGEGEVVGF